ncbi:hypothetical protein Tco_0359758 [Tanacetum coccineum]
MKKTISISKRIYKDDDEDVVVREDPGARAGGAGKTRWRVMPRVEDRYKGCKENACGKEGKEPNEDENRLDTCDSTQDPNNVKCVKTLGRSITGDNEKVNIARNVKEMVSRKGVGRATTMEPKRFTFERRNIKSSKEDVGRKSRLSRIRSKGGESNGVQASDMDVYTTSNTKEVAKEDELKSIGAKIGVVWEGSKNNEHVVEEESVTGFHQ